MPFRYVLKWDRGNTEKISIKAYPRYPSKSNEKRKPTFEIGSIKGSRAIILRDAVESSIKQYGSRQYGKITQVNFPKDNSEAIAMAYRIGLTAAVLREAPNNGAVHKATSYILDATNEEIWFWTSKLLDKRIGPEKAVTALCIISGAKRIKRK
jgi:hypothetical protein